MTNATASTAPAETIADPLPPARIAMWFVLASDLMFFVGLVGAFIVLRTGNASLFADHATGLNKAVAGAGTLALMISSVTMFIAVRAARNRSPAKYQIALVLTLLAASVFIGLRSIEYVQALEHHTIVWRQNEQDPLSLFDGRFDRMSGCFVGYAATLPPNFDPHVISENDVARIGHPTKFYTPSAVFEDISYSPSKNIFYAIWYTLTGAHLFQFAVAMIAVAGLILQAMRKKTSPNHAEFVGTFWHFAVFVGVILFPLLYLS